MIEDFLAEMRAEGLLDSAGQFTLNAARARERLQHYQFKDPHEYVLAIYRCAVLSGASRFDCQLDADDCILEFDGRPLSQEDFLMLWGTLFMRQDDLALARLRYLALGLNAALGFETSFVTLESFGWQVTIRGREETAGPAQGRERTRVHVRRRAGWTVAQRFVQKLRDLPPEGAVLRSATRYGGVPVRINGRSYAEPPVAPAHPLVRALVTPRETSSRLPQPAACDDVPTLELTADFGAVLYLVEDDPTNEVEFVVAGVSAGRQCVLDDLTGVVSTPRLLLDASQSELVTEERFGELFGELEKVGHEMVRMLARSYPDQIPARNSAQANHYLWEAARNLYEHPNPAPELALLAEVPLVPMLDGSWATFAHIAALGPVVRYSEQEWPDLPQERLRGIVTGRPHFWKGLEVQCADEELHQLCMGLERRRAWEKLPAEEVRVLGPTLVRVPVEGRGVEGEVALTNDSNRQCWLYKTGRLMHILELGKAFPSGLSAAISHPDLEMDDAWLKPLADEAFVEVKDALCRGIARLFAVLPAPTPPGRVWDFLAFLAFQPACSPWPPEGAVAELKAIPTTEGPISLADLEAARRQSGSLYYLLDGVPRVPSVPGLPPLRFPILCLTTSEVAHLVKVLPDKTLQLAREHPDVQRRLNYTSFLRRPEWTGLSGHFLAEREAAGGRLAVPRMSTSLGLELWLTHNQRQVCRVSLEWPFGPIAAELPVPPELTVTGDWNNVVHDEEWEDWLIELREETRELGAELAGRLEELESRDITRARLFLMQQLAFECQRCQQRMEDPETDPLASRLMAARIFVDLAPQRHSAHQLLHASPRVGYVEKSRPLPAGVTEPVLLLSAAELTYAQAIFGASRLVNRTRHLASFDASSQPVVPLPERDYIVKLEVPGARVGVLRDPRQRGEVLLCCCGQVVETVHSSGDVPHCGVIDHAELNADPDWTRIVRDATFQQVVRDLQLALLRTVEEWLEERRELGYLVELLRSLSQYNPLREQWGSRPVLAGWRDLLTLTDLERRLRVAGPPEYLSAEVAAELKDTVPPAEWPQLCRGLKHTNPVVAAPGWHSKVLGRDVSQAMVEVARELEFERRCKLKLDLDHHWPDGSWLLRRPVAALDSLQGGELGLLLDWEGEGLVLLAHKGVRVGQLDPKLGLAVRACLDGFFPPADGRRDELRDPRAARQLVLPALLAFLAELARDSNLDEELRARVLLHAWSRLPSPYASGLDVRFLPLEGGRRGDVSLLKSGDRVLWMEEGVPAEVPEDGRPRRGNELALELRSGSALLADLQGILGRRLVKLVPAQKRAAERAEPPAAAPAAAPPADNWTPEAPEEQLLGRLRSEFRLLGEGRTFALPEGYLTQLHLVSEVSPRLCWLDDRGLALNSRHPAVVRTLRPDSPPRHLYLLLSSLFSAINRADALVTDVHEREFHSAILATLVGE